MAIKGKGKPKARQVARAPRRAPVEVPKPLVERTWVRVVAAGLLGAFAVVMVVWVTNALRASGQESDEAAALERRQDALSTIRTEFEAQVGTVGQIQDPLGPILAPQVRQAAQALEKGKESPIEVEELEQLVDDLDAAAAALEGFDLAGTIRDQGFDAGQTEVLIASRGQLVAALRDLQHAAAVTVVALEAGDRDTAVELATSAIALADTADALSQEAWRTYRNALVAAELAESLGDVGISP